MLFIPGYKLPSFRDFASGISIEISQPPDLFTASYSWWMALLVAPESNCNSYKIIATKMRKAAEGTNQSSNFLKTAGCNG